MTEEEFDNYLADAIEELEEKQDSLAREYGIGHHDRFVVEYDNGILTFFEKEKPVVEGKILSVATHVREKDSLKWFWADERLPDNVREESSLIKELYDVTGFEIFSDEMLECDEEMAWEICALACKHLQKLGAYRIRHGEIDGYVLFNEIKKHG